jgi:hypothetical protein
MVWWRIGTVLGIVGVLVAGAVLEGYGSPASQGAKPPAAAKKASGPLGGYRVYLCDEKGNRILEVNAAKKIVWEAKVPAPDDLAPTPRGNLVVNSDVHDQVYEVSGKTGKITWTYGQFNHPGGKQGQLRIPEDSFRVPGGRVSITDTGNFRAIQVSKASGRIVWQYGKRVPGTLPGYLWTNNDAVPLKNGNVLLTESGVHKAGFLPTVLEVTPKGHTAWKVTLPFLGYASDAMPVGKNRYVIANWVKGGGIYVFNRQGKVLWSYGPKSGPGELNHPSSAELLPNGNYLVSDDYNDRVVVISPKTNSIVWQYGVKGVPGTGPNHLMGPTDAKAVGEPLPPYVSAVGRLK